jgi:hypothetical protein
MSPFLIPKDRDHDFSSGKRTFKLLRPWGFYMVQLCRMPLVFGFIMVDTDFVFLENLGQKPYPSVSYWGTRSAGIALLVSLCVTVRIRGTQAAQTLVKTLSAVVALALDRVGHVIGLFDVTVAAQLFINSVVVLQHR